MTSTSGGQSYGRHRGTNQTASSGAVDPSNSSDLGTWYDTYLAERAAREAAIEDAGIRAGEIIGYRAWIVRSELLMSVFWDGYVWQPKGIEHSAVVDPLWGAGLHAFKTIKKATSDYGFYGCPGDPLVIGEVALWGKVIEHERGYRAEYAAIRRLISIKDRSLGRHKTHEKGWRFWRRNKRLANLRDKYGVIE